jgi:hypothetical protein
MTKVEELRNRLTCGNLQPQERYQLASSLIAAAEAQGIEKGAEQMKETLRKTGMFDPEILFEDGWHSGYRIRASVLSPAPKEVTK